MADSKESRLGQMIEPCTACLDTPQMVRVWYIGLVVRVRGVGPRSRSGPYFFSNFPKAGGWEESKKGKRHSPREHTTTFYFVYLIGGVAVCCVDRHTCLLGFSYIYWSNCPLFGPVSSFVSFPRSFLHYSATRRGFGFSSCIPSTPWLSTRTTSSLLLLLKAAASV